MFGQEYRLENEFITITDQEAENILEFDDFRKEVYASEPFRSDVYIVAQKNGELLLVNRISKTIKNLVIGDMPKFDNIESFLWHLNYRQHHQLMQSLRYHKLIGDEKFEDLINVEDISFKIKFCAKKVFNQDFVV